MDQNKENRAPNLQNDHDHPHPKEKLPQAPHELRHPLEPKPEEQKHPLKPLRESANNLTPEKMRTSLVGVLRKPSHHFSPGGSGGSNKVRARIAHSENKSDMKITPVKRMSPSSCYSVCSGNCEYYGQNSSPMEFSSGSNSFKKNRPHPHIDQRFILHSPISKNLAKNEF